MTRDHILDPERVPVEVRITLPVGFQPPEIVGLVRMDIRSLEAWAAERAGLFLPVAEIDDPPD